MREPFIEPEPTIILRKGANEYYIQGVDDISMTKRELNVLLHGVLKFRAEEVAIMYFEFKEHPNYKLAHFGMNGTLLFCK